MREKAAPLQSTQQKWPWAREGRSKKKNPGCGTTTGAASKPVPAAHGAELGTL